MTSSKINDVWNLTLDCGRQIELRTPADWRTESDEQTLLSLRSPDDVLTSLRLQYVSLNQLAFSDRVTELWNSERSYWQQQGVEPVDLPDLQAFEARFLMRAPAMSCILRKVYVDVGNGVFVLMFMTRAEAWSRNSALYRQIVHSIDVHFSRSCDNPAHNAPNNERVTGGPLANASA